MLFAVHVRWPSASSIAHHPEVCVMDFNTAFRDYCRDDLTLQRGQSRLYRRSLRRSARSRGRQSLQPHKPREQVMVATNQLKLPLRPSTAASCRSARSCASHRSKPSVHTARSSVRSANSQRSSRPSSEKDESWKDEAYYKQQEEDRKYMLALKKSLHKKIHGDGSAAVAVSAQKVAWFSSKPPYQPLDQPALYQWCSTANGVRLSATSSSQSTLGPAAMQEYTNFSSNTGFGNRARCCPDNPRKIGDGVWEKFGSLMQ